MHRFRKQPSEEYSISVDFSEILKVDETITKETVTASLGSEDKTTDIIASSTISDKKIIIKIKDGEHRNTYKLTIVIETSGSNIFEEDILMRVIEI